MRLPNKPPRWLGYLALALLALVSALPLLTSLGLELFLRHWLSAQGAENIQVERLRVNPYSGTGSAEALSYRLNDQDFALQLLRFDVELWALWGKRVHIRELTLTGVDLVARQTEEGFVIDGLLLTQAAAAESVVDAEAQQESGAAADYGDWHVQIDNLAFEDLKISFHNDDIGAQLQVQRISIANFSSAGSESQLHAELQLPSLDLPSDALNLQGGLVLDGALQLTPQEGGWQIALDSSVRLQSWQVQQDLDNSFQLESMDLKLKTRIDLAEETVVEASWDSGLGGLQIKTPEGNLGWSSNQSLQGNLTLRSIDDGWKLRLDSNSRLRDWQLQAQGLDLGLESVELALRGDLTLTEALDYRLQWQTTLGPLQLREQEGGLAWGGWQALQVKGEVSPAQLQLDELSLQQLALLSVDKLEPLVQGLDLKVELLQLALQGDAPRLSVAQVSVPRAQVRAERKKDGSLPQLDPFLEAAQRFNSGPETAPAAEVSGETEAPDAEALAVDVGLIELGPEVVVAYEDATVRPKFRETITVQKGRLKELQLQNEQQQSPFEIGLLLSNDATAEFKGAVNVLRPSLKMDADLQGYQLLSVSGFSREATGYSLESGRLNFTSAMSLDQQQINSKNHIVMDGVRLRAEKPDQAEKTALELSMPLDQALDLLRDGKGRITLDVPVNGDLSDPDISLQQIINKALAGAVTKTTVLALKIMLQPYGALMMAADYAKGEMGRVRLEPVQFAAGQAELDAVGLDYTGKLAEMLSTRETLSVRLCGTTNRGDLAVLGGRDPAQVAAESPLVVPDELQQPLHDLAQARSAAVRQQLLGGGVKASQLQRCLPEFDGAAKAPSAVALSM
ncbi:DUF748 domain-containing protein [Pseudomaricurvus sp. HS19]|uniref:DUF748 domain-containing protein n=1 Tax=Pseudomaricurvus sp. HS19 TaxID=2692626 RepID=UPI00136F7A71|nr:DUF748 domain-containing protein [Pseudomaricurvus sp. HS19]MYM63514.1 DUF748 domain-containing protein [Pseudomaricurvus sp. HS19]